MIGLLTGKIALRNDPFIILDVNGVGYKVYIASSILSKLPEKEEVMLFIHTQVKEDAIDLYGFITAGEQKLFEQLISVSGIGPKTAIGVFNIGTRDQIITALMQADVDFFTAVPRLGRKNAQKLIIELKNKIGALKEVDLSEEASDVREVVDALTGMGFSEREAREAVKSIGENGKSVSDKVKMALKTLGK